jgi:hypothetical protein
MFCLLSSRRACLGVCKQAQRGAADHLTGVLVTSRSNLSPDEGIQFSSPRYVLRDLILGDLSDHPLTVPRCHQRGKMDSCQVMVAFPISARTEPSNSSLAAGDAIAMGWPSPHLSQESGASGL